MNPAVRTDVGNEGMGGRLSNAREWISRQYLWLTSVPAKDFQSKKSRGDLVKSPDYIVYF